MRKTGWRELRKRLLALGIAAVMIGNTVDLSALPVLAQEQNSDEEYAEGEKSAVLAEDSQSEKENAVLTGDSESAGNSDDSAKILEHVEESTDSEKDPKNAEESADPAKDSENQEKTTEETTSESEGVSEDESELEKSNDVEVQEQSGEDGIALMADSAVAEANGQMFSTLQAAFDKESAISEDGKGVKGKTTVKTAPERVVYIGEGGVEKSCVGYEVVTKATNGLSDRWYVVKEDTEISTLYLNGYNSTTNLILCDGATLTASFIDAIQAPSVTLNIYLQSGGTGKLVAMTGITLADDLPTVNCVGTPMKMVDKDGKATSNLTSYFEISKCDHDNLTYTKNENSVKHTITCNDCGLVKVEEHTFSKWEKVDEMNHKSTCDGCGYETTVEHEIRYTENPDGLTHKSFCKDCDLTAADLTHVFYNGKCVDCYAKAAAQIGGKIYTSLPAALNAAQNGDTIKLLANYVTNTRQ